MCIRDREIRKRYPAAEINGIAIEPMIQKANGRELVVGMIRDKIFGPTIVFGPGGTGVETFNSDRAVALPPLNSFLVADMLASTRITARLGKFRSMPPVDMAALEATLLSVSAMVCELPWISGLDINPLIVDEHGAVAVDARITIENTPITAGRYEDVYKRQIKDIPARLDVRQKAFDPK